MAATREATTIGLEALTPVGRPAAAAPSGVDAAIQRCGFLPQFISETVPVGGATTRTVDAGGIPYEIFEQRLRQIADVVDHAYLQDMAAEAWPGAVIQGEPLTGGDTALIPLRRAPGVLSIVTDLVAKNPGQQSARVTSPSAARVGDARRKLLESLRPRDSPGLISAQYTRAHTLRDAAVKLGLDIRGASFSAGADASFASRYETTTVVASIRQTYYTASFEPERPGAGGVFPAALSVAKLRPYIGAGNPPLLITRVHYGRVIVITATAKASSQELQAALRAQWDAAVSGSGSIEGRYKEIVESAEVRLYAAGATFGGLPKKLTNPVADLDQVYRNGLKLSVSNPGMPIGFVARHLFGRTLAHVGLVAEYVQPVRAVAGDVNAEIPVWDGPGGGAADTGIDVAPGDRVVITGRGQTWSGVWGTEPHGPEGWLNWKAPAGSPLPQENAHCLIGRFGNGAWFRIGDGWEGTNHTGATGRLRLNINDNNPHNGDPKRRFAVTVQVTRRPAAAAGIYV